MEGTSEASKSFSQTDLEEKIVILENDNKRLRDEFDNQRAKLKDLFLQKEGELDRKSKECNKLVDELNAMNKKFDERQLEEDRRKAEEEINSLQELVHETVEASSQSKVIYDMELKKLQGIIQRLEHENKELRFERQPSPIQHPIQEQLSLAPSVMLSAVTKTLARKLRAESFASQDSMEESMRKVDDDHAQEDVEVLRSLVVPLEEEIKALKDKLRAADEQMQQCSQCRHIEPESIEHNVSSQSVNESRLHLLSTSTNTSFETSKAPEWCDMCSNYEAQLVREQKRADDLQLTVSAAEKSAERHREELLKEIGFRKEIEEKWNEKKEQHKQQVADLTTRMNCSEQDLKELQQHFQQTLTEVRKSLSSLTQDREKIQQELNRLQKENDNLVGKYSLHSEELENKVIDLPDTVEKLQEVVLTIHQELIITKIGKESAEENANTLRTENLLLKDQITNDQDIKERLENNLVAEINSLKTQQDQFEKEKKIHLVMVEKLCELENTHQVTLMQVEDLNRTKKQLEDQINELKSSVGSLQQELDNSEAVQKDFVRLSQNLQVQLEKIRDSDTQVRWQHEDDIEECPTCRSNFNITKRKKQHCRHCGQIFCMLCLSHTVPSGPKQRLSKVCDVCHTLLVKSSAPYFSTEVPHSPS